MLDTLAAMTAESIENSSVGSRDLRLARIAVLVAVVAPEVSYLLNVGPAADSGVTLEDVQGLCCAIAPIVGTTRTVTAARNTRRALGFIVVAIEAKYEAELEAGPN